jgi:ATP-dependent RNA helicase HelY
VLSDSDLAAGDFVRWCKQLVDLMGQIAIAASLDPESDDEVSRTARAAMSAILRGVIAA